MVQSMSNWTCSHLQSPPLIAPLRKKKTMGPESCSPKAPHRGVPPPNKDNRLDQSGGHFYSLDPKESKYRGSQYPEGFSNPKSSFQQIPTAAGMHILSPQWKCGLSMSSIEWCLFTIFHDAATQSRCAPASRHNLLAISLQL